MSLRPLLCLLVEAFDVGIELGPVHAPDTPPADLDGGELAGTNQRVDLRHAHRQVSRHVLVLLMSAGLVVAVWGIAHERLLNIVSTALSNVCGSVGC